MLDIITKSIKNPKKAWRFFSLFLVNFFRKKKGILLFIGMEPGGVFSLMHRGYEKCYGLEAYPERFEKLQKKYRNNPRIHLFNAAAAGYDGEITFNISSNNDGASSSIGSFKKEWGQEYKGEKIEMIRSITVLCINLYNFCKKHHIDFIDEYVSDIQGMDLEVLKTLKPMIDKKQIGRITCEVTKNEKGNVYNDLPDNSENGFSKLLNDNYKFIAKGWGVLKDNTFDKIPEDAWEMDCRWILKD